MSQTSTGAPSSADAAHGSGLHRNLRVWEVTALSVGFMGPVMAMSLNGIGVAGLVGKAVPFTFVVSFVGTLLVAYAFIRLTRYFTHAGSVYALAGATLGPRAGFFGGFALLGTYLFFSACIVGACAVFFDAMLGELGLALPGGGWIFVGLVSAAAALALNLRESTTTTRTLLAIGMVGIVAMLLLSVIVIARVATGSAPVSTGLDLSTLLPGDANLTAIMTASVFGFLSWAGFESGTSLGEETHDPKRTIPRALTYAVVLAGVIYTLVMFAQTIGYGTDADGVAAFAGASSTLTEISSTYIGPWFAVLISVIAFCVAFASLMSCSAAAARLVFALARDGFGPAALARTNPRTGAPSVATVTVIALTVLLVLLLAAIGGGPIEVYYWYATIATLCMVVAYGMASVGVIRHTFRPGSPIRRWETVVPTLGLAFLVYVYVVQVAGQEPPYSYFPWIAGAWCLLGLVVILAAPSLAQRIGARLTVEDLG
ncbi:APC family permease [Ornithinimicrobium tianjinense]|uniref:Amino acid permease n=1 Tax=Ornithinimicrobium tianjinense TaxID=1195761 RepID=A0A917BVS4_9MICO|nr:APC family permease [Ornithinimicrobium tianjinense]GGF58668.1 amino acid permease [Ornithinimicrobium tianjinense]